MQAHSMAFSKVINSDQGAREHFHVPKYQREYAWGRKEWEQLLLDIEENDLGYFMGSLICVNDSADPAPGDELIYEVVDGQQRLTTIVILLECIRQRFEKEGLADAARDIATLLQAVPPSGPSEEKVQLDSIDADEFKDHVAERVDKRTCWSDLGTNSGSKRFVRPVCE